MDSENAIVLLLKKHNIRVTCVRQQTLKLFLGTKGALTHSNIENTLGEYYDRVTIYRTLKTFEQYGLIHKVIDDEAVIKYALCHDNCSSDEHIDNHIHFKCQQCGITYCLDHVHIPQPNVPQGFVATDIQLLIKGTCKECGKEEQLAK